MAKPKIGDLAPDFSRTDQDGKEVALGNYRGKKLILFFYPRDNTPTCSESLAQCRG